MTPLSIQTHSSCPECGAIVAVEAPRGLCPACLMRQAMEPTEGPVALGRGPTCEEVAVAFPQLEVIERIGQGGMGVVFRARQPNLGRLVALKVIPVEGSGATPDFAERFEREGRLLARLHHPNIVTIFDSGRAGDFFYLLMEHVDGVNLRQAMRAGRFTPAQALGIVPRICDALHYAHEEGVLHRDIKPENILLDAKGRVKLVDFGIAKLAIEAEAGGREVADDVGPSGLTRAGMALGTPSYMAPEQATDPQSVDHRADIYSLGVVFYELLTGELPPGGAVCPSERAAVDQRVDAIVQQALERERTLRQRSAEEMKTQIEAVGEAPNPAASRGRTRGVGRWVNRWARAAVLAVGLVLLLRAFVVQVFVAEGDAAAPELPDGSWVVVWKLPMEISPGEFIAYEQDGRSWLGRVMLVRLNELRVRRYGRDEHVVPRGVVKGKVIAQRRRSTSAAAGDADRRRAEFAEADRLHREGDMGDLQWARAKYRLELAEAGDDPLKVAEATLRWAQAKEARAMKGLPLGGLAELDAKKAQLGRLSAEADLERLKKSLGLLKTSTAADGQPMADWIQGTWAFDAAYVETRARVADTATTEEVRRAAEEVLGQIKASIGKGSEAMRWTFTPTHIETHHAPGGLRSDPYTILDESGTGQLRLRTNDEGREKTMILRREGERLRMDEEPPVVSVPHIEVPSYFRRVSESEAPSTVR